MPQADDIWYAAQVTRVVYAPTRSLETFGETSVRYCLVSELLDEVGRIRLRRGRISAERPRVIMPRYFVKNALENFGEEAQQYIEDFLSSSEGVRIIQYGLRFRKEEHDEEVVAGPLEEVADQVAEDVRGRDGDLHAVIIGVDDLWEVSLLHFLRDLVLRSLPANAREMAGRGLLTASSGGVPNAVRIELESDFRAAVGDRSRLRKLGDKLQTYGLFEEYEDRFYRLLRSAR